MPRLSIILPTYDRPALLGRAVASALAQTLGDVEVIVVDDASPVPIAVPDRVRLVRLPKNRGVSGAQNAGIEAATGDYVAFLDDDDVLLPHFAETALAAIEASTLPPPVAAVSGLEVVRDDGVLVETRVPPTLPRGRHYQLERGAAGRSFFAKQTLVAPRSVLRALGGFDGHVDSREDTDLFLRLNPVCSIEGVARVGYRHTVHAGARISDGAAQRHAVVERLLAKHAAAFRSHPRGAATFLAQHAATLWSLGARATAVRSALRAARYAPVHAAALLASTAVRGTARSASVSAR